jgi:hypothetical protein
VVVGRLVGWVEAGVLSSRWRVGRRVLLVLSSRLSVGTLRRSASTS